MNIVQTALTAGVRTETGKIKGCYSCSDIRDTYNAVAFLYLSQKTKAQNANFPNKPTTKQVNKRAKAKASKLGFSSFSRRNGASEPRPRPSKSRLFDRESPRPQTQNSACVVFTPRTQISNQRDLVRLGQGSDARYLLEREERSLISMLRPSLSC